MKLFKNWKKLIKMIAIILLIITMFNFLCTSGLVYAEDDESATYSTENNVLGGIADGIVGFLTLPMRLLIVLAGGAIDVLTSLFVNPGEDVDVETILFNNLELTSVNFFKTGGSSNEVVKALRDSVAIWYTAMRNIALAFLVIICIYVGIRMALSTVADEKAQYKRMLVDWVSSLALVFVMHYIMVAIIQLNNILVKAIEGASINGSSVSEMSDSFRSRAFTIFFIKGTTNAITYFILQLMTITILLMYIKRMITVAFLMMLAPLVTITYSIDKMGDGKAQALNTWLKEFSYTILIQPFHCLAFAALGGIAKQMAEEGAKDLLAGVFTILLVTFILQSEKIVKKIFHFESSSVQDVLASAAIASSFMDKGRGFAKKTAGAAKAAKELKGNMPMIKDRLKNGNNQNGDEQKQLPKEKTEKKPKEKPIDYSSLTDEERKKKLKELQDRKLRLQTGATKKELAFRAFMGANKIGLSTAIGMGIGGATGSDQALLTKGFQDFTNSTADAMKKGREFSQGRLKHEVAKAYNTAREGVMAEIKQQYLAAGKGRGKSSQEQEKELEKIFDDRMKGLLTGKTKIETVGEDEKELAKLLNEMKGSLIIEGHKSNDAIEGCLSLLKEIEAGEVSEVWSGEGAGAVPTYILGEKAQARNVERTIEEMKRDYNNFTDSTDKFPEVADLEKEGLPDPNKKK